jgi:PTH1 family peptidyl-tRNA hydrolase
MKQKVIRNKEPEQVLSGLLLIVGLGNPGPKYLQTRHNAGFWFLDALLDSASASLRSQSKLSAEVCRTRLFGRECVLAKPTTFMNHSGQAVRAVMDYYRISTSDLLVAYDELDLAPGTIRLKQGGGHGGHNGLRDIFRHLDSTDFLRLRIGIGHPGFKEAVTGYVLSRAPADQEQLINATIADAVAVMPDLLSGHLSKATKELHTDS